MIDVVANEKDNESEKGRIGRLYMLSEEQQKVRVKERLNIFLASDSYRSYPCTLSSPHQCLFHFDAIIRWA